MARGTHWEWRGFGRVSNRFLEAFVRCPLGFEHAPPWDHARDEYYWFRASPIYVRLRTGGTPLGLKLKRFVARDRDLELWFEDPNDLHPLGRLDHGVLNEIAATLGVRHGGVPAGPLTSDQVARVFRTSSPPASVLTVSKTRQIRRAGRGIQIEFSKITRVTANGWRTAIDRPLFSIAVRNSSDLTHATPDAVDAAREETLAVLAALNLAAEPLRPMNYLEAIETWTSGATG